MSGAFLVAAARSRGFHQTKIAFNDGGAWQADGSKDEVGHVKLDLKLGGATIQLEKNEKRPISVEQGRAGVVAVDQSAQKMFVIDDRTLARRSNSTGCSKR